MPITLAYRIARLTGERVSELTEGRILRSRQPLQKELFCSIWPAFAPKGYLRSIEQLPLSGKPDRHLNCQALHIRSPEAG
jgi:hypothetical protein